MPTFIPVRTESLAGRDAREGPDGRDGRDGREKAEKGKQTGKKLSSSSSSGMRKAYDVAFTALRVGDLFSSGYSSSEEQGDGDEAPYTPRAKPSVSVLRGVVSDLVGVRCIPSTLPLAPAHVLRKAQSGSVSGASSGVRSGPAGESDGGGAGGGGGEEEFSQDVSAVVWAGSLIHVVIFPATSTPPAATVAHIGARRVPVCVTEVDAVYTDVSDPNDRHSVLQLS